MQEGLKAKFLIYKKVKPFKYSLETKQDFWIWWKGAALRIRKGSNIKRSLVLPLVGTDYVLVPHPLTQQDLLRVGKCANLASSMEPTPHIQTYIQTQTYTYTQTYMQTSMYANTHSHTHKSTCIQGGIDFIDIEMSCLKIVQNNKQFSSTFLNLFTYIRKYQLKPTAC